MSNQEDNEGVERRPQWRPRPYMEEDIVHTPTTPVQTFLSDPSNETQDLDEEMEALPGNAYPALPGDVSADEAFEAPEKQREWSDVTSSQFEHRLRRNNRMKSKRELSAATHVSLPLD